MNAPVWTTGYKPTKKDLKAIKRVHHVAASPTGSVNTIALLGLPWTTLGDLAFDDCQALWSGCLDAPTNLVTGSHRNLITNDGKELVYASFEFRALCGSW
jgi:hypothetical protein